MSAAIDDKNAIEFARSVFTNAYPPHAPFHRGAWVGVAFDRNRHERLAPAEWWDTLTSRASSHLGEHHVFAFARASLAATGDAQVATLLNTEASIFEYLDEDARFLKDQCLVGESGRWACLLDQDVSLFGGDAEFMEACFAGFGGRSRLLATMREEFIGADASADPSDPFVADFESYFQKLLTPENP